MYIRKAHNKINYMRYFQLFFLFTFSYTCSGQTYTIDYFQSEYDTIVDYNSATLEQWFSTATYYWEVDFDLGFDFPFYDLVSNVITLGSDGIGYFPQTEEFNLFLYQSGFYLPAPFNNPNITPTTFLDSEIRYSNTIENGLKNFTLEYHNVYFEDELYENGPNHIINFQTSFYENGIIEVRFGEMNLDSCSYYFPGEGFSFDNEDSTNNIYGPWVFIVTDDYQQGACFAGDHNAPELIYDDDDNCEVLESVPPSGFVIRFRPSDVSSIKSIDVDGQQFYITQQGDMARINGDLQNYHSCTVYDLMGRKIIHSKEDEILLGSISNQVLLFVLKTDRGEETHKVVR